MPRVRMRGRYHKDAATAKAATAEAPCSKDFSKRAKFTAGIFTLVCPHGKTVRCVYSRRRPRAPRTTVNRVTVAALLFARAGICYGFNVMREAESVDHVFEIVRTRFPTGRRTDQRRGMLMTPVRRQAR